MIRDRNQTINLLVVSICNFQFDSAEQNSRFSQIKFFINIALYTIFNSCLPVVCCYCRQNTSFCPSISHHIHHSHQYLLQIQNPNQGCNSLNYFRVIVTLTHTASRSAKWCFQLFINQFLINRVSPLAWLLSFLDLEIVRGSRFVVYNLTKVNHPSGTR